MEEDRLNQLFSRIIGAAIDVHREPGSGLLESIYAHCMVRELQSRELRVHREVPVPIRFKSELLQKEFLIDLLVENEIIIELKSVETIILLHESLLLSLLRLSGKRLGRLINFKSTYSSTAFVVSSMAGIKRLPNWCF